MIRPTIPHATARPAMRLMVTMAAHRTHTPGIPPPRLCLSHSIRRKVRHPHRVNRLSRRSGYTLCQPSPGPDRPHTDTPTRRSYCPALGLRTCTLPPPLCLIFSLAHLRLILYRVVRDLVSQQHQLIQVLQEHSGMFAALHIWCSITVSYTHLRAHETKANLVCR